MAQPGVGHAAPIAGVGSSGLKTGMLCKKTPGPESGRDKTCWGKKARIALAQLGH